MKRMIRLLDWRDWQLVKPVRLYLDTPVPADLKEVLQWPTYHSHGVWEEIKEGVPATATTPEIPPVYRILAYGTIGLCADGKAEATEMVVLPEFQDRGLESWIRSVQCRDLPVLGFPVLYQAARSEAMQAWCATHMDRIGTLPDGSAYFRGEASVMRQRLAAQGAMSARHFDATILQQIERKREAAWAHLEKLHALADTQRAKLALRSA